MQRLGIVSAVLGIAAAVSVSLNLMPAEAQESSMDQAWELDVVSYSSGDKPRLAVVKHNKMTGQTLILTCDNRCDSDEVWRDFAVEDAR